MLVTDGATEMYDDVFEKYNWPERKVSFDHFLNFFSRSTPFSLLYVCILNFLPMLQFCCIKATVCFNPQAPV